ncbi:hypothetical protein ElyMa_004979500 [Elysia marginata]|uniref:Uncharacterized protein n=1 Tax=Elysia marginata TaxID=1093978 RepID=A0AAV4J4Z3_9GAST|nr:hypothetical protein ElyMa_004979500 [Elysia marginata]
MVQFSKTLCGVQWYNSEKSFLVYYTIVNSLAGYQKMDEMMKATQQKKAGKASGDYDIPTKLYKATDAIAIEAFHDVLLSIWEEKVAWRNL